MLVFGIHIPCPKNVVMYHSYFFAAKRLIAVQEGILHLTSHSWVALALLGVESVSLVSNKEKISGPMQPAVHFPVESGYKWSIQVHLLPSITQLQL